MKITTFKVPITLKRGKDGKSVELSIDEDAKTLSGTEELEDGSEKDILKITKQISDFNEMQKTVIKGTLMEKENESKGFIKMQILT